MHHLPTASCAPAHTLLCVLAPGGLQRHHQRHGTLPQAQKGRPDQAQCVSGGSVRSGMLLRCWRACGSPTRCGMLWPHGFNSFLVGSSVVPWQLSEQQAPCLQPQEWHAPCAHVCTRLPQLAGPGAGLGPRPGAPRSCEGGAHARVQVCQHTRLRARVRQGGVCGLARLRFLPCQRACAWRGTPCGDALPGSSPAWQHGPGSARGPGSTGFCEGIMRSRHAAHIRGGSMPALDPAPHRWAATPMLTLP